ncbi:MAG: type II toxin-antitoxin system RelE family toxin [Minisyncoccales bacterium]
MLKLIISKQSAKFLKKIHPKHSKQIAKKIMSLRLDPIASDSKILKDEFSDFRGADIGEFRIIYNFDKNTLTIFLIGKRNDDEVYKILKRKI